MPPGTVYTFNLAAGLARPPADGMMGGGTPVGVRVAASADNNLIAAAEFSGAKMSDDRRMRGPE